MAETTAHTEAPGGGNTFPPFQTENFPSQLIWLAVTFVLLYALMSRIALIPRSARHQAAARRFVDYLLSSAGQTRLVQHSLGTVRNDMQPAVPGYPDVAKSLRPIALNIDLLTYLDRAKRGQFLKQWKKTLQGQ